MTPCSLLYNCSDLCVHGSGQPATMRTKLPGEEPAVDFVESAPQHTSWVPASAGTVQRATDDGGIEIRRIHSSVCPRCSGSVMQSHRCKGCRVCSGFKSDCSFIYCSVGCRNADAANR